MYNDDIDNSSDKDRNIRNESKLPMEVPQQGLPIRKILLVGKKMSGKSLLVNMIYNYINNTKYDGDRVYCADVQISNGKTIEKTTNNEVYDEKKRTYTYTFNMKDYTLQIIDTEGYDLSDGTVDNDMDYTSKMDDYQYWRNMLEGMDDLYAICVVHKSNNYRDDIVLRGMCRRLKKLTDIDDIRDNIFVCLTDHYNWTSSGSVDSLKDNDVNVDNKFYFENYCIIDKSIDNIHFEMTIKNCKLMIEKLSRISPIDVSSILGKIKGIITNPNVISTKIDKIEDA